jgi:hypothetical protein
MQTDRNPLAPLLHKCAAALRAGTLRYGDPDPDGCLHPQWPANYPPELRAVLDKGPATSPPERIASAMDTMAFYFSPGSMERNAKAAINPARNFGSMPLIVLTASDTMRLPPDAPADVKAQFPLVQATWSARHDAYAALSTRGVNRVIADTPHYIQLSKPQVVIDAVDEVVDEARADMAKARR